MQLTNTVHPPAGANPIIAILGRKNLWIRYNACCYRCIIYCNFCINL